MSNTITSKIWGTHNGDNVFLFTLQNTQGFYVHITNFGATIVSMIVPDRYGVSNSVVLGFDNLNAYLLDNCYIGSTIGRFSNRLCNSTFTLNHKTYFLEANEGVNSNHSGSTGFHKKVFNFKITENRLILTYKSPNNEGGFPGNLEFTVTYEWTENNQLKIIYYAECDEDTIANFTNHTYFNLSGDCKNILNHRLKLSAKTFLEVGNDYIPSGNILHVKEQLSGLNSIADQLKLTGKTGLNEYFIINDHAGSERNALKHAATLEHEESGRRLDIYTTYPGLMVYTGDHLHSSERGRCNKNFQPYDGLCLECQLYPDAPNHNNFPPATLRAGEKYYHAIIYAFSTLTTQ